MAAACNATTEIETSEDVNPELIEAHIVAQAITELQQAHVANSQEILPKEAAVFTSEGQTEAPFQAEPGQTHLIYYIEDGSIARSQDRTLVDSSVQANDYDIERRSGRLPARKRVIPVKFRDYKNTSADEDSDSDYDPHEYLAPRSRRLKLSRTEESGTEKPRVERTYTNRKVGRPRKNFFPDPATTHFTVVNDRTDELEKKYEEAIVASMQEVGQDQLMTVEPANNPSGKREPEDNQSEKQEPEDNQSEKQEVKIDGLRNKEEQQSGSETTENVDSDKTNNRSATESVQSVHGMKTRGVKVIVPGAQPPTILAGKGGWGRGRPRLTNLPFYRCTECHKTFKQKGNLKAHLRLHVMGSTFFCQEEGCNKTYRSNESLRRHLLTHQGIKPFQCDFCEKRFSSNISLTEHRSRHLDEKPYQCEQCKKCFRQISCFRRHLMTHSDKQPYVCKVCNKGFAQTSYLKSHMKVHTGEKPYQCAVCSKRFAHQSDVKRHSTTHTGEKRYSCSKCQARFSDVSSRNRHEKDHDNVKRYSCTLCNDSFRRIGQVRSHLNKKHSQTFAVTLNGDQNRSRISLKVEDVNSGPVNSSQQRIVTLIKNLHSKALPIDGQVETLSQNVLQEAGNQPAVIDGHVTDISQLEEVDASVMEEDVQVGVEVHEDNCQTFIAITDLAESLGGMDKELILDGQVRYRLLYEVDENGEQRQILVPCNPGEAETIQLEYNTLVPAAVNEDNVATETIIELPAQDAALNETEQDSETVLNGGGNIPLNEIEAMATDSANTDPVLLTDSVHLEESRSEEADMSQEQAVTEEINVRETDLVKTDGCVASGLDYVNNPDFSKQEYYNWLTNFTDYCKVVPMPLNVTLFQKISQVHKTLSDVMATPSGVIADKENFRVLMTISKELSTIINEHLVFVLQNLSEAEKPAESKSDSSL